MPHFQSTYLKFIHDPISLFNSSWRCHHCAGAATPFAATRSWLGRGSTTDTTAKRIAETAATKRGTGRAWRPRFARASVIDRTRSEEHTSELQSLMRISYAVFCLNKKKNKTKTYNNITYEPQTT